MVLWWVKVGGFHLGLLVLAPFYLCLLLELSLYAADLGDKLIFVADQLDRDIVC